LWAKQSPRRQVGVQIPAARFSDAWEIFFGLKRFAKMRGFGGFSVRGEFVTESLRVAGIVTKMLHAYFFFSRQIFVPNIYLCD
jgi:hypothetical protein